MCIISFDWIVRLYSSLFLPLMTLLLFYFDFFAPNCKILFSKSVFFSNLVPPIYFLSYMIVLFYWLCLFFYIGILLGCFWFCWLAHTKIGTFHFVSYFFQINLLSLVALSRRVLHLSLLLIGYASICQAMNFLWSFQVGLPFMQMKVFWNSLWIIGIIQ